MTDAFLNEKPTLSPHLIVKDISAAISFYKQAFGAVEDCRLTMPGSDWVIHAGLRIGNSFMMLGAEANNGECMSQSPLSLGGTPVVVYVSVDDVDAVFQQALDAGAEAVMPPTDMFWGDRFGKVKDPFGHEWSIATQVKKLSQEEIQKASDAFFSEKHPVA